MKSLRREKMDTRRSVLLSVALQYLL